MGVTARKLAVVAAGLCLALGWMPSIRAQEQVPPELVYAERYLEKGWYREAWELIDPLVREAKEPGCRLLLAAAEATYGLERIGEAVGFTETIAAKEEKAQIACTDPQRQRLNKVSGGITERFGVLRFEWPPAEERAEDLKAVQTFVLEWADEKPLPERDKVAFDQVFQRLGREGVSDGDKVYLPKGRVSVNGIWKDIGEEPAVFMVALEKPPARQRNASGDGLGFAVGLQGLPGYQGNSYADQSWEAENLDDLTTVGIGARRYALVGMPRLELSATHSLITQGWRELGLKTYLGFSPPTGIQGSIPEGDSADFLPAPAPFWTLGLLGRQSLHGSHGLLVALSAGVQGLYTPVMRYVAQGTEAEEAQTTCSTSTAADLMIVDRKVLGAGVLGSFEASKNLDRAASRIGIEATAGYNLIAPVPAKAVEAATESVLGATPCFEDEDVLLTGWDLRAQLFFRIALW